MADHIILKQWQGYGLCQWKVLAAALYPSNSDLQQSPRRVVLHAAICLQQATKTWTAAIGLPYVIRTDEGTSNDRLDTTERVVYLGIQNWSTKTF